MSRISSPLPLLVLLATAPLAAQSTLDSACVRPEHRQFDFWVGSWTVTDTAGRTVGTNEIVPIAGGCGLREHWRSAAGGEGMSLNVWQPGLDRWTQFWVGAGTVLRISGTLDSMGRMVMTGRRTTPKGPVRDRITWTPLPDGAVRQTWDISADGGATWDRAFEGVYRRRS